MNKFGNKNMEYYDCQTKQKQKYKLARAGRHR